MEKRNKLIICFIIIFLLVLMFSLYLLIKDYIELKESYNENKELSNEVIINDSTDDEDKINWDRLLSINKDIIGWIEIENTNINYPIVKDDGSLKYLKHSFNGKYNKNGSIFTLNSNPFIENETIIYGHNMRNKTMFSELDKYMKKEFFNKNNIFYIDTEENRYKVTVFSVYSIGIFEEEQKIKGLSFEEKIDYYKKISKYTVNEIGKIEKIVKLSTCSYLNSNTTPTDQRYYIIGRLEEVD